MGADQYSAHHRGEEASDKSGEEPDQRRHPVGVYPGPRRVGDVGGASSAGSVQEKEAASRTSGPEMLDFEEQPVCSNQNQMLAL